MRRYCGACWRLAGAGDISECCDAPVAERSVHDWTFDAALAGTLVVALVVSWAFCRYVPGAPLNLLARVQALEAGRCACK